MATTRRRFTAEFKARVVMEALRGDRTILAWRLSNTLDTRFCVEALEEALEMYGNPEIFNTDQGSQFTSIAFTEMLVAAGIRCSMDGRGRCLDNVFIQRLWRSLKYEAVYLHEVGGRLRGAAGDRRVDRVLQRGTTALGTRWPDAVRGLPRRRGAGTGGGVTDMGSRWQLRVPRSEGERVCDPVRGVIHNVHRIKPFLPRTPSPCYRHLFLRNSLPGEREYLDRSINRLWSAATRSAHHNALSLRIVGSLEGRCQRSTSNIH